MEGRLLSSSVASPRMMSLTRAVAFRFSVSLSAPGQKRRSRALSKPGTAIIWTGPSDVTRRSTLGSV